MSHLSGGIDCYLLTEIGVPTPPTKMLRHEPAVAMGSFWLSRTKDYRTLKTHQRLLERDYGLAGGARAASPPAPISLPRPPHHA